MRRALTAIGAILLAVPAFAADQATGNAPTGGQAPYDQAAPAQPRANPSRTSGEVVVGAGFGGFTSDFGNASSIGASWDVRGGVNALRYLGGELNYQGTSSTVSSVLQSSATPPASSYFVEQQITADLKLGYPMVVGRDHILRPYGIAGVGYGHISVNSSLAAFGFPTENAAAFPLGLGFSYNLTPGFVVDARYTYNFLTETVGNNWNVGFNVGATFGG